MKRFPKDIHWHMIGHLQRNKVKYIIDKAELIHSVDSMRLVEAIRKKKQQKETSLSMCFWRYNVAKRARVSLVSCRKRGWKNSLKTAAKFPHIRFKGSYDNCAFCR